MSTPWTFWGRLYRLDQVGSAAKSVAQRALKKTGQATTDAKGQPIIILPAEEKTNNHGR